MLTHTLRNHYSTAPAKAWREPKRERMFYRITLYSGSREPYSSLTNAVYTVNLPFLIPREMMLVPLDFLCVYSNDGDVRVKLGNIRQTNSYDTVVNDESDLLLLTCKPNPLLFVPRFQQYALTYSMNISSTQRWLTLPGNAKASVTDVSSTVLDRPIGVNDPYVLALEALTTNDPFTPSNNHVFGRSFTGCIRASMWVRSADGNPYNFLFYGDAPLAVLTAGVATAQWQQIRLHQTVQFFTQKSFRIDTDGGLGRQLLMTGFQVELIEYPNLIQTSDLIAGTGINGSLDVVNVGGTVIDRPAGVNDTHNARLTAKANSTVTTNPDLVTLPEPFSGALRFWFHHRTDAALTSVASTFIVTINGVDNTTTQISTSTWALKTYELFVTDVKSFTVRFSTQTGVDRYFYVLGCRLDFVPSSDSIIPFVEPFNQQRYTHNQNLAFSSDDAQTDTLGIPVPSSLVESKTLNIQLESVNGSPLPTNEYTLTLGLFQK